MLRHRSGQSISASLSNRTAARGQATTLPLNVRLGWLLRANRLLAADGKWAQAKRFASALAGKGSGGESRISRWETGSMRPSYHALVRYEDVLELPPGVLTSAVDTAMRYAAAPGDNTGLITREVLPNAALDELIDRALSASTMTGAQWDQLTSSITLLPDMVIAPRAARSAIVERLLSEMIIAHGIPWQQRFEALNRLLNHPTIGYTVIDACASLGADPTNQVFIETIGALDGSTHPEASRRVLAQLIEPTNERALRGALIACIRKVQFRHFSRAQAVAVARRLRELCADPALHHEIQPIVTTFQRAYRDYELTGLADLERLVADAERPPSTALTTAAQRIARSSSAAIDHELPAPLDDVYQRLVVELLSHPHGDTRLYTAMLIAATPYRAPIARTLSSWLADPAVTQIELRLRMVTALRVLGGEPERSGLERLVIDDNVPPLAKGAAFAIGHLEGPSNTTFWRTALAYHTSRWRQRRAPETASVLSGLVYSLGVGQQRQVLILIRDDPTSPMPSRAAAQWWLNVSEHIYRSACR